MPPIARHSIMMSGPRGICPENQQVVAAKCRSKLLFPSDALVELRNFLDTGEVLHSSEEQPYGTPRKAQEN
jgi:hypothetical protein